MEDISITVAGNYLLREISQGVKFYDEFISLNFDIGFSFARS